MVVCDAVEALCRIFWGPDPAQCEEILSGSLPGCLAGAGSSDPEAARALLSSLKAYISAFSDAGRLYEALEPAYVRLFISDRRGISAPLYQSCYQSPDALLMGPPAREMKQRLEGVGLALSPDLNEPPDHLAIELEYLYFLLKGGTAAGDRQAAREAASFAGKVMLPWVRRMAQVLEGEAECPFYPLMVRLLVLLLQDIAADSASGWPAAGDDPASGDGRQGP